MTVVFSVSLRLVKTAPASGQHIAQQNGTTCSTGWVEAKSRLMAVCVWRLQPRTISFGEVFLDADEPKRCHGEVFAQMCKSSSLRKQDPGSKLVTNKQPKEFCVQTKTERPKVGRRRQSGVGSTIKMGQCRFEEEKGLIQRCHGSISMIVLMEYGENKPGFFPLAS